MNEQIETNGSIEGTWKMCSVIITTEKRRHEAARLPPTHLFRGKYSVTNDGKKLNARMWETTGGKQPVQPGKKRVRGYMWSAETAFEMLLLEINSM